MTWHETCAIYHVEEPSIHLVQLLDAEYWFLYVEDDHMRGVEKDKLINHTFWTESHWYEIYSLTRPIRNMCILQKTYIINIIYSLNKLFLFPILLY